MASSRSARNRRHRRANVDSSAAVVEGTKKAPLGPSNSVRIRRRLRAIGVACCAVIVIPALILLLGEIAVRLAQGRLLSVASPRRESIDEVLKEMPEQPDSELGWVPRPGYSGSDNPYQMQITIDAQGFRSNGARDARERPVMVAVGDSFTWGTMKPGRPIWKNCLAFAFATPGSAERGSISPCYARKIAAATWRSRRAV